MKPEQIDGRWRVWGWWWSFCGGALWERWSVVTRQSFATAVWGLGVDHFSSLSCSTTVTVLVGGLAVIIVGSIKSD